MKYKEYKITEGPFFPYEYAHEDFDGAPDAEDIRCGWAYSVEEAKEAIDEIEERLNYRRTA